MIILINKNVFDKMQYKFIIYKRLNKVGINGVLL